MSRASGGCTLVCRGLAAFALAVSTGCLSGGKYRIEMRERSTGAPVGAVLEVAQVDESAEAREVFDTRDVWLVPGKEAHIWLWNGRRYRLTLFEQPPVGPIPERDRWVVLEEWPQPLRPGEDQGRWHASLDRRFELRLSR